MEIRIYNRDMEYKGCIENQTSFQWNRKYNDVGSFELHVPITTDNMKLIALENLVWFRGAVEVGVMEDIKLSMDMGKHTAVVKGRFAESYFDRRLIRPRINFSGTVEDAMRKIITDAVAIPHVVLGERHGYADRIDFQATYKEVLGYEKKLAQSVNYGFRLTPDFTEKELIFDIYQGVNHSNGQNDRNKVIFSEEYGNLTRISHQRNQQVLKNVGYVGGQGEGLDRMFVTVGDDTLTGYDRRELYIDAKDIQQEEGMTDATYQALLTSRGNEKLGENVEASSISVETDPYGNFVYKRNYDLGDIVTVKKSDWNIAEDLRITAIAEVYEKGYAKIVPTFGTPLASSIKWED